MVFTQGHVIPTYFVNPDYTSQAKCMWFTRCYILLCFGNDSPSVSSIRVEYGPLTRYVKLRVTHAPGIYPLSQVTATHLHIGYPWLNSCNAFADRVTSTSTCSANQLSWLDQMSGYQFINPGDAPHGDASFSTHYNVDIAQTDRWSITICVRCWTEVKVITFQENTQESICLHYQDFYSF